MATIKLYLYAENTALRGRVAQDIEPDESGSVTDDVFLYGEGSEEELILTAIESLAKPCDRAPHFRHKCDRAVLEFLGGPDVEPHYGPSGSYWLPIEQ